MLKKGFTLIELIIVVAIIALLAAATFVAVNPAKRIGEAQNAGRWTAVTSLADAVAMYIADNAGALPSSIAAGSTFYAIQKYDSAGAVSVFTCNDNTSTTPTATVDMDAHIVDLGYLGQMPEDPDPDVVIANWTGYFINISAVGVIQVGACSVYNNTPEIEVFR